MTLPYDMPVYSVVIALYDEAEQVGDLLKSLEKLKWPRSKIEIKFVVEYKDRATKLALEKTIHANNYASFMEVIVAPPGSIQTKPRALNYVLPLTRGQFVVLYDAEDRPHPYQLLEAWNKFQDSPSNLGCLQAPLQIRNTNKTLVSMIFGIEYQSLFRGFLPAIAHLKLVFPLGGTSNHFKREALIDVGAWDPHNVTEDADLGLRLVRHGYSMDVIHLPTLEEAPQNIPVWIRQRTRWFKGWMQTLLVHLRNPAHLMRQIGFKNSCLVFVLFFGIIAAALVHPFVYFIYGANLDIWSQHNNVSMWLLALDGFNIVGGFIAYILLCYLCCKKTSLYVPFWWPVLLPFYWTLCTLAAWRAVWHLAVKPFYWEKTPHIM